MVRSMAAPRSLDHPQAAVASCSMPPAWPRLRMAAWTSVAVAWAIGASAAGSHAARVKGAVALHAEADLEGAIVSVLTNGSPIGVEVGPGPWLSATDGTGHRGFVAGLVEGSVFVPTSASRRRRGRLRRT